jgi:tape measure domain-containing protein
MSTTPTNLQVNASTAQAVGAFNNLLSAINGAQSGFQRLAVAAGGVTQVGKSTAAVIGDVMTSAFSTLSSVVSKAFAVLEMFGAGVMLVFHSLLKELDKIQGFNAIMSVTTKRSTDVATSFNFVRQTADRLGIQFDSIATNYSKLLAAIPEGNNRLDETRRVFLGVAMAARTMHASNQDTQLMFYAITQIASKGIVSMEELRRQLGEKLPGVMQIAAKALSTTPQLLEEAIRKGIVVSEKFLPILGDAFIRTFSESAEKAAQSVSASMNRLTNVWTDFVKAVLDSGAGQSIVSVFDALREKLSDPYLIQRFAEIVRDLSDRFAGFIKNLTADDIRKGFDIFSRGVEILITLVGKLIEGLTWMINNAGKVGAIAGAIAGAAGGATVGAAVGSVVPGAGTAAGAAVGTVVGGAAGAYAGYRGGKTFEASPAELQKRLEQDQAAEAARAKRDAEAAQVAQYMLKNVNMAYKLNYSDVPGLFTPDKVNWDTLKKMADILSDPRFKTQSTQQQALKDLAKYGEVLNPAGANLQDVIGSGKKKRDAHAEAVDNTLWRSAGFNGNFKEEWANLSELYKNGTMDVEELEAAQKKLLEQQPFMVKMHRDAAKELASYNKGVGQAVDMALKYVKVKEEVAADLSNQRELSKLTGEDLAVETGVLAIQDKYRQAGFTLSKEQLQVYREQTLEIIRQKELTETGKRLDDATINKWKPKVDEVKAIKSKVADPLDPFKRDSAREYVVGSNTDLFSQDQALQTELAKRRMDEYYAYINSLREADVISEEEASRAKARVEIEYSKQRLAATSEFFGNIATLSRSGNAKLAAIGKAAAVAQATIDGILAVQKALASAPPPINYALAASVGIATAVNIANILKTPTGFKTGGYTGDFSTSDVAGVVHGREFVVNADATSRYRNVLEAMNRGYQIVENATGTVPVTPQTQYERREIRAPKDDRGRTSLKVSVENYATGVTHEVHQISADEIRIIARQEARSTVSSETPNVVASELANPNSRVSKGLRDNYDLNRKR